MPLSAHLAYQNVKASLAGPSHGVLGAPPGSTPAFLGSARGMHLIVGPRQGKARGRASSSPCQLCRAGQKPRFTGGHLSPPHPRPHGGMSPRPAAYLSNLGDHHTGRGLLDYGEFATCHSGYSPIVISNSKGSAAPGWFTVPAG